MESVTAARCVYCGHGERWLVKHPIPGERPTAVHAVGHDELRSRLFR